MLENIITVVERYWSLFLSGLGYTLLLALITVVCGTLLGSLIALMRMARFRPLSVVATAFIEVIRGTPLLLQLYVFYFLVPKIMPFEIGEFTSVSMALVINSTAYVAEIIRAGILAVDRGQTEAARSLGMDSRQTMVRIVMPQAVKNILPALCNELIVLLKETSISGYIALQDLTKAGDIVRSRTYSPFFPYISVALMYLALVLVLEKLLNHMEGRLARSDR